MVFFLGGCAISWASKLQKTTATSSTESEYVAVSYAAHECVYLRRLVCDLLGTPLKSMAPTKIWEDNTAARKWCYNPVHHAKQKHIDVAHHFVREQIAELNNMEIIPIGSAENVSDVCTKSLPFPQFEYLMRKCMNLGNRSLRTTTTSSAPTPETPPTALQSASDKQPDAQWQLSPETLKHIANIKQKRLVRNIIKTNKSTAAAAAV
jgi:hypothetical protein